MQVATQPRTRNVRTAADRRFRRYGPEEERALRVPEVVENETLTLLRDAWREFISRCDNRRGILMFREQIEHATRSVEGLDYSAKDVENLSLALAEFQDEKGFEYRAGKFLSALINKCEDTEFVIYTQHLGILLNHLGYGNTKNITIIGDVGGWLGQDMQSGTITINGHGGKYIGYSMHGGTIYLKQEFENLGSERFGLNFASLNWRLR